VEIIRLEVELVLLAELDVVLIGFDDVDVETGDEDVAVLETVLEADLTEEELLETEEEDEIPELPLFELEIVEEDETPELELVVLETAVEVGPVVDPTVLELLLDVTDDMTLVLVIGGGPPMQT